MASIKNQSKFPSPSKLFIVVTLLAVGFVSSMYLLGQNTDNRQQASQSEDLNTSNPTLPSVNPDGSMGPASSITNFSKTLPAASLGNLVIKAAAATSPGISPAPSSKKENNNEEKEDNLGKNSEEGDGRDENREKGDSNKGKSNNRQSITSLIVTINKMEVHLANKCDLPSPTTTVNTATNQSSNSNSGKRNGSDKWETLDKDGSITLDLVNMAKLNIPQTIGITSLACGKYTEIRLYITKAEAILADGKVVPVTVAGKAGIVRIVRPFSINPNQTTNLTIEFNAEKSVISTGNFYILKPVVGKFISDK